MLQTLSTTEAEVIPQKPMRKSLGFINEDASISIFLKKEKPGNTTVSSTDHDIRIVAGDSFTLNHQEDGLEAVQERWTAIAASGTPVLAIFETEDVKR